MSRTIKLHYPMVGGLVNGTPFTVANTGGGATTATADGWRSALTSASEAQVSRVDFAGGLLFDIDKIRRVMWRMIFGTIPTGSNFYFGLATANAAAVNDITARVLFQMKGSNAITLRTDDGVTDSNDIATPWTPVSGDVWEFELDFASGVESAIPNYLSKTGKSAIKVFGGKDGQRRQLQRLGISMAGYSAGLQLFSRIDKASGTSVGDATVSMIEVELER